MAACPRCYAPTFEQPGHLVCSNTNCGWWVAQPPPPPPAPPTSPSSPSADFDGDTYDPALDGKRLRSQLGRVFEALLDGAWHTLPELAQAAKGSEAGVSARVRDLRKPKFGGYNIERRRRGLLAPHNGVWEYRMVPPQRVVPAGGS